MVSWWFGGFKMDADGWSTIIQPPINHRMRQSGSQFFPDLLPVP
jgi:hypothetical protein